MKTQKTKQDVTAQNLTSQDDIAQDVTVIVEDRLIIVDGRAIQSDNSTPNAFTLPKGHHEGLRALQWHNGAGDCECAEKGQAHNHSFGADKYEEYVKPFVDMWEAQRIIDDAPPPPKTLAEAKEAKKQAINTERDSKEQAGFIYDGSPFDTNQVSYMRLLGASQTAQTALAQGQAFSVEWTLADNTTRTMSAEDMVGIIPAFSMYSSALHAKASELKAQVDAVAIAEGVEGAENTENNISLAEREAVAVATVEAISIEFIV